MRQKKRVLPLLAMVWQMHFLWANAQEMVQWRGIDRTGHYKSNKLLPKWPDGGPELLLAIDTLPESYSSVVVKDGTMYTTGVVDTLEMLTAIGLDGSYKWATTYGKAWSRAFENARCTPTIEDSFAYVVSGCGDLACINTHNGKIKWGFDGYSKFNGVWGTWGVAESPLIVGDKMIYTPCGPKTTVVALNKHTGETIWMSESIGDQGSYCSPILAEQGSYQLIVTVTANYVVCFNAENGELFWKFAYTELDAPKMGGVINPVSPVAIGNDVFVTSGYNHVGVMLHMADDFRSVSLKWKTADLDVHHGGVVVCDGFIYGANFTSLRKGNWVCIDWETGELQYEREWYSKGSIISSGSYLFCFDELKGNLALVEANPKDFNIVSSFVVEHGKGPYWSHPSIFNDKLFVRHGKALMVYDIGMD